MCCTSQSILLEQATEILTEPCLLIPYSHYSSLSFILVACEGQHYAIQCITVKIA